MNYKGRGILHFVIYKSFENSRNPVDHWLMEGQINALKRKNYRNTQNFLSQMELNKLFDRPALLLTICWPTYTAAYLSVDRPALLPTCLLTCLHCCLPVCWPACTAAYLSVDRPTLLPTCLLTDLHCCLPVCWQTYTAAYLSVDRSALLSRHVEALLFLDLARNVLALLPGNL